MRTLILCAIIAVAANTAAQASDFNTGPAAIITCPAKGPSLQEIDLSTGGAAPWVVEGPGIPNGKARATPIDDASVPPNWKARISGARWMQAMPANKVQPHALGDFVFTISFQVKKSKRMPRLSLTGQAIADEMFELNLIEPAAPNQHISSGISMGDDSPGLAEQGDVQDLALTKSGGQNIKPLGLRAGIYSVQIVAQNNEGKASEVGVIAGLKLGVKCGGK